MTVCQRASTTPCKPPRRAHGTTGDRAAVLTTTRDASQRSHGRCCASKQNTSGGKQGAGHNK
eukprot:121723-Prymnesium_polylepis.1